MRRVIRIGEEGGEEGGEEVRRIGEEVRRISEEGGEDR